MVVLIAGIADPGPLIKYVSSHYKMIKSYTFTDHHHYSIDEINRVCEVALREGASVVTTEKDVVRLDTGFFESRGVSLFYLPIQTEFVKNGKEFDEMVLNVARSHGK